MGKLTGFACKGFGGFLQAVAASVELEEMAMVHERSRIVVLMVLSRI